MLGIINILDGSSDIILFFACLLIAYTALKCSVSLKKKNITYFAGALILIALANIFHLVFDFFADYSHYETLGYVMITPTTTTSLLWLVTVVIVLANLLAYALLFLVLLKLDDRYHILTLVGLSIISFFTIMYVETSVFMLELMTAMVILGLSIYFVRNAIQPSRTKEIALNKWLFFVSFIIIFIGYILLMLSNISFALFWLGGLMRTFGFVLFAASVLGIHYRHHFFRKNNCHYSDMSASKSEEGKKNG